MSNLVQTSLSFRFLSLSKNKQLSDDDLREAFKVGLKHLDEFNVSYSNLNGSCFADFRSTGFIF
jgi:hypothetical protein